jgi:TP901 family phage tail tape measure protein
MELIRTQAGATQTEVNSMTQAILKMAPTVGTGPEELAAGLYHIESAGLRGAKALQVLQAAAEGAKVGHADLESVTNALIAAVNSGVGGITNMSQAMGTLNAIVGSGNMRMNDLTGAMSTGILSSAKTFGLSMQDVGAAIADMTNQGIPAQDAATRLRMTISLLGAPTTQAAKELASVGISSRQLADDMRKGGLLQALTDLSGHLKASGKDATEQAQLLSKAFGGGRSSSAILTLLGSLGKYKDILGQIKTGAGSFGSAWEATSATTAEQMSNLTASVHTLMIAIGTGLLPAFNMIVAAIVPLVSGIAQLAAANPQLAATVLIAVGAFAGLVAILAFAGPIMAAFGVVVGVLTSPILLVVGAIAGFLLLLSRVPGIMGPVNVIVSILGNVIDSLAEPFERVVVAIQRFINGTGSFQGIVRQVGAFIGALVDSLKGALPLILAELGAMAQALINWIAPIIPQVVTALGSIISAIATWAVSMIGPITSQLMAWAQAFIGWIEPMIPPALTALTQLVRQIVSWIASQVPGWVTQLAQWATAFIQWIAPIAAQALTALTGFAQQIIGWVLGQLPTWTTGLLQWANAFVAWIGPMIVKFVAALAPLAVKVLNWLVNFGLQFTTWFITKLVPNTIVAVLKVANAILSWLVPHIPDVIGVLVQMLGALISWFGSVLGSIEQAAMKFGEAIVNGIMSGIGDIGKTVGDKLNSIPGVSLIGGVAGNAIKGAQNVVGAAGAVGRALPGSPAYHGQLGGVVPGATGMPVPVLLHGGETVLPAPGSLPALPAVPTASVSSAATDLAARGRGMQPQVVGPIYLQVDGQTLAEWVDRGLFMRAAGANVGLVGSGLGGG